MGKFKFYCFDNTINLLCTCFWNLNKWQMVWLKAEVDLHKYLLTLVLNMCWKKPSHSQIITTRKISADLKWTYWPSGNYFDSVTYLLLVITTIIWCLILYTLIYFAFYVSHQVTCINSVKYNNSNYPNSTPSAIFGCNFINNANS